jgi:hypothetical protein
MWKAFMNVWTGKSLDEWGLGLLEGLAITLLSRDWQIQRKISFSVAYDYVEIRTSSSPIQIQNVTATPRFKFVFRRLFIDAISSKGSI